MPPRLKRGFCVFRNYDHVVGQSLRLLQQYPETCRVEIVLRSRRRQAMETEFLQMKWKAFFNASDINKDGVITVDDADMFAERFASYHKLDKQKVIQLRSAFRDAWKALLLYGREKMDPEDFIAVMSAEIARDWTGFRKRMQDIQERLLNIFDVNGDGLISDQEFVVVLKCWGMKEFDHKFIEKFHQSPTGYIPKHVMRDAWVEYYCNGDPANITAERPILETLGLPLTW